NAAITAAESTLTSSIASAVAAGDASTLSGANGYTDAETTRATGVEALKANLAGGNIFTGGKQTLAASTTAAASMNVPAGVAPTSTPGAGDLFAVTGIGDSHLNFVDQSNATQKLAFLSDITSGTATTITGNITELQVNNLVGDLTAANAATTAETARATGVEGGLTSSIAAETGRAEGAEGTLTTSVNTLTTNLASTNAAITAAESTLTSSIASAVAAGDASTLSA